MRPLHLPGDYGAFERLINYPQQYAYGAVIGYNMSPTYGTGAVSGKGSAFFLHVQNAYPPAGASRSARTADLAPAWMKAGADADHLDRGSGSTPYNVIPNRYH